MVDAVARLAARGRMGLTGLALYIESTRHKPMLDWHWMTVPQMLIFAVMGAMARLLTSGADRRRGGLMARWAWAARR